MKPVSSPIIAELKKLLPEESWSWVIPAIQEDPLVWEALISYCEQFGVDELGKVISSPEDCSPASLALVLLKYPSHPAKLRSLPLLPLESQYAGHLKDINSKPIDSLNTAGLQALYLRQLRLQSGSWDDWSHELWSADKTSLSCLFGIVPDQLDLLRAIVPFIAAGEPFNAQQLKAYQAVIHIILSNPLKIEAQTEILNILLEELNQPNRFQLIEYLSKTRPNLASRLVRHLSTTSTDDKKMEPKSIRDYLFHLENLYTLEETQHIARQNAQEASTLMKSLKITRQLQAKFAARIALAGMSIKDQKTTQTSWEQAFQLDPDSFFILPSYLLWLLDQGRNEEVKSITRQQRNKNNQPNPIVTFIDQLLKNNDPITSTTGFRSKAELRASAQEAIDSLVNQITSLDNSDVYEIYLQTIVVFQIFQQLAHNDLLAEAIETLKILYQLLPGNMPTLVLLAHALQLAEQDHEAVNIMHLGVAFDPQNLSLRRYLATCLEAIHSWEEAYFEWKKIIEHHETPPASDWIAEISTAIRNGQFSQAIQSCRIYLKKYGEDGVGYALMGKAVASLGEVEEGQSYLELAIQLTPTHPATWLALADFHKNNGHLTEMEETLMAASHTISGRPEIYLALGDYFLSQEAPTQAVTEYKRAFESVNKLCKFSIPFTLAEFINQPVDQPLRLPENFSPRANQDWLSDFVTASQLKTHIIAKYGKTLLILGHNNEARQALEEAYYDYPNNNEVATVFAESLIKQQEYKQAIEPLRTVVAGNPNNAYPYLAYAKCLLELDKTTNQWMENSSTKTNSASSNNDPVSNPIDQIVGLLEKAIQLEPANAEAKVYLAETRAQQGELENALSLLNQAIESQTLQDVNWKDRIALDFGEVTLKLRRGDLALATLKDANQNNPEIQRKLAEAYQFMDLTDDAFRAAQNSLQLTPDDLDNLVWFVNFSQELKDHHGNILPRAISEAKSAIRHAIELAPQRSDLWVLKGSLDIKTDDREDALNSFRRLVPGYSLNSVLNTPPTDLYVAGKYLVKLNDPDSAIACLEYALQHNSSPASQDARFTDQPAPPLVDLLIELGIAYKQKGESQNALQAFDHALVISPNDIGLHLIKADLFLELGSQIQGSEQDRFPYQDVIACLEKALNLEPNQPTILLYLTLIKRASGDLPAALYYADHLVEAIATNDYSVNWEQRFSLSSQKPITKNASQALAFDIAIAMLQNERAKQYLDSEQGETIPPINPLSEAGSEVLAYPRELDYFCLQLENALEQGKIQNDVNFFNDVPKAYEDDPQLLGMKACLQFHQGDSTAAVDLLKTAFIRAEEKYGISDQTNHSSSVKELAIRLESAKAYRLLAHASRELAQWNMMQDCLDHVFAYTPNEPQPYLDSASSRVLRAEVVKLSRETGVKHHAPAEMNFADEQTKIQEDLQHARELISTWAEGDRQPVEIQIKKINARSQAIFEPNPQTVQLLADLHASPDDIAAQISCLRSLKRIPDAQRVAEFYPRQPLVLLQLALTLADEQPQQALLTIQSAAENLSYPEPAYVQEANTFLWLSHRQITPIVLASIASLTLRNDDGNIQAAAESIEKALQIWPNEPVWHFLASQIFQLQDSSNSMLDTPRAIAHLEQAIILDENNWEYSMQLGTLFLRENLVAKAIETLKTALKIATDKPEIWAKLAEAYWISGNLKDAKECLEKAIRMDPQDVRLLVLRGEIALKENDHQGVEIFARRALDRDPEEPTSYLLLARSLSTRGKTAEAQALLEKNFPHNSRTLPLYLERAKMISQQEGLPAAIENLQQLAESYPNQPSLLGMLAELYEQVGDQDKAIQIAQQALRVGHNLPDNHHFSQHAKLHCLLGRLSRNAGQLDQSVQHLNEAILLEPGFIEPYLELGQTHLDRRQFKEAFQSYQQAIQANPKSALPYYQAGLAYKQCKDYNNAELMLREAAKLSPDDLSIQRQLAAVIALNLVHNRKQ